MPNEMMMEALKRQRSAPLDLSKSNAMKDTGNPGVAGGDLESRVAELEQQYDEICKALGITETPNPDDQNEKETE